MELVKFRITNFRSINDSGEVSVEKLTSLVGRNESGKSNLLLALATLNPPGGRKPLNKIKDFPRGRRLEECNDGTPVVASHWKLAGAETNAIGKTLGSYGAAITEVEIRRDYGLTLRVDLGVKRPTVTKDEVESLLRRLGPALTPQIAALGDPHKANSDAAWKSLEAAVSKVGFPKVWADEAVAAAVGLRARLGEGAIILTEDQDKLLAELENKAKQIAGFDGAYKASCDQIIAWLPIFIYVSEFPELYGHQNLDQFLNQRGTDPRRKEAEDNFEKMARVAGFDPKQLNAIRDDHETRNQLLNRAGSVVTQEIRRLWKDRPLKVRFHVDGPYLDTLISDPNAVYDVEVNLDERSRGFRWFFAFYITFAADTKGGNADGAVLLLDEPGLHLHAKSQGDLLKHLRADFRNQIIYTTHSPFMVPSDAINIVRTVNIDPDKGTHVTDLPSGDARTLFPLQAALGYHLSQTLFVGHSNLIVEGVTDFWIISSVSAHLGGGAVLPEELTITPAGGAGKVPYMAALLASEELKVLVLLDDDGAGRDARTDLVKNKLLRDSAVMFVTEGFDDPKPVEADIEDLIDPAVYTDLVNHTYSKELAGKSLALNPNIPRIVKRFEEAFAALGMEFHKTRPAREFMSRMGTQPAAVLPGTSAARFEAMFKVVRDRYNRLKASDRGWGIDRRLSSRPWRT
jgi:energy-coupling factor transporter ATP-binding protein EcfA2